MLASRLLAVLIGSFNIASVGADGGFELYGLDELVYEACTGVISAVGTFCASSSSGKGHHSKSSSSSSCSCKSAPYLGTVANCYMELGNVTSHIQYFLDECEETANVTITLENFYKIYDNATNYFIDPATEQGFSSSKVSEVPLKINNTVIDKYFLSYKNRYQNFNFAHYYGWLLISYWFFVMFVATVCNWIVYFLPWFNNNPVLKSYRQYLSLPAVHRRHAADGRFLKVFHFLIPNRLDTVLIGGWIIIAITSQTVRMNVPLPNAFWDATPAAVGRIIADRSGVTSLYTFPLLILFAGRNNFLQFFTRWKHARMIAIHRYVARITVILVVMHAIGMSISGYYAGVFDSRNQRPFVRWGWVAASCGVFILIQASLYIRRKSYEAFYLLHILMAIFFTVGGHKHVSEEGYAEFYWAAIAIWAFDRVIRLVRLFSFGMQAAKVELKAEETLRVTIPKPSYWKAQAGQHVFVHFMRPTCFWQSHPFTLGEINEATNEITLYAKIKGGITHGLYKYLSKQSGGIARIHLSVEGPYGSAVPLKRFDSVLFLSGGNGVPGLYAEAKELLQNKTSKEQRIQFYWIIRHWKSLSWFLDEMKTFEGTAIKPVVYVTRAKDFHGVQDFISSSSSSSSSEDSSNESDEKKQDFVAEKTIGEEDPASSIARLFPHVEFREGRPDIEQIIQDSIDTSNGSLAVVGCAHPQMVDDVRAAVVHNMGRTSNLVEFFDQLQVW